MPSNSSNINEYNELVNALTLSGYTLCDSEKIASEYFEKLSKIKELR